MSDEQWGWIKDASTPIEREVTVEHMLTDLVTFGNVSIGLDVSKPRARVITTLTPTGRYTINAPITQFAPSISEALAAVYGELIARINRKEVTR